MQYIYNQNIQIDHHMFMKYYIMILIHQESAGTGTVTDFPSKMSLDYDHGASMEHPHWLAGCMDQH